MRGIRIGTVAVLVAVLVGSGLAPASALGRRIVPETFGVQDDWANPDDSGAWGTARMWAAWCTVQPTADTEIDQAATRTLTRAYQTYVRSGARRLTVSLGHPSAWVFDDHPTAKARNPYVWYCEASMANTSFPTASSMRSGRVHDAYVAYVTAVIRAGAPYLAANPANRLVLQAWNEPNLRNGGTVTNEIPGAARSWSKASKSLRAQERILREVARTLIPGRYEISSPSLYGKTNSLNTEYFQDQARSRTVDSFSINFYTLGQRSVNTSLAKWRRKGTAAKKLITSHRTLRKVPIWLTETNHNLTNGSPSEINLTPAWASPAAQKRMTEVTTMEALRLGFAGIQWYQGTLKQVAVNTRPGTPATLASLALRRELVGRRVVRCSTTKKKRTTCTLTSRHGSGRITVAWSAKGSAGVRITR
ncbi:MAG: hypothetical protein WCF36_03740 [Candidatus Nanopelagicales bacterium]